MKRLITLIFFILTVTGSLTYANPQQSNKIEDKILHKTLDELTKELGKPTSIQLRGAAEEGNEAFIIDSAKRNEILNRCESEDERKRVEELIRPIDCWQS